MITLQDLQARLERFVKGTLKSTVTPRATEVAEPGVLAGRVFAALARIERLGTSARPLEVAVGVLEDGGVSPELLLEALGKDLHWFGPFMRVLELGEAEGIWDGGGLKPGAHGSLELVWDALQAEGVSTVLAVYLERFLRANGRECFTQALRLMKDGGQISEAELEEAGDEPLQTREPAEERAEVLERALALVNAPSLARAPEQPSQKPGPVDALDVEESEETAIVADVPSPQWLERLAALNVNQVHGERVPAGWFARKDGKFELYLRPSEVAGELLEELTAAGLVLMSAQGHEAGPQGFTIRAGKFRFPGVVAIDVEGLRAAAGAAYARVEALYTGPDAAMYDVVVLGGTQPKAETPAETGTSHPCPRCSKPLRGKRGQADYLVCSAGCGFAVQRGADGEPAPVQPCEECGGDAYLTVSKGKLKYVCLTRCGRKAAQAAAA